ncbi:MAG: ArsB/NhaD family transporter [Dehalogenimonas sp.]|uniref:ArsB/NhaD family transporter n=1 Tax=Candidatus Dehalogenimonas loeffleri TaxID=3127115 RepID=A0ABZ2JB49_9CHLR|nr:ArsB/NhaD family transporter [Dehalogenimonas sp.]
MLISLFIFLLTIIAVLRRPAGVSEAVVGIIGAAVMIGAGYVSLPQTYTVVIDSLNVVLFFLGLMIMVAIAEVSGLVETAANTAARFSHGNGRLLLLVVFGIGIIITILLSNDATVLILTPVVLALTSRFNLNPLPYVFACAFVANASSMLLPIANPVNLLAIDAFDIRLPEYLIHLLLPGLTAIAVTISLFMIIFRREVRTNFTLEANSFYPVNPLLMPVLTTLGIVVAGYILFSVQGWPLSIPVLSGAIMLLAIALTGRHITLRPLSKSISWSILPFIVSLAVLVQGLANSGLIQLLGDHLTTLLNQGEIPASLVASFGTAVGANLFNNWPMMMISVETLRTSPELIGMVPALPYQVILGADLGPNIAIFGSFSTLLWFVILRRRGLNIKPSSYLKLGVIVTLPALLFSSLVLILIS